jgi:geranylgeranylglycerol-phosphate geranylgeranyltransferase
LFIVAVCLPAMYAALVLLDGSSSSAAALAGAMLLIAAYDVAGKSIPVPAVADVLQGLGWAGLVLVGAELSGGATSLTVLAVAQVTAYVAVVNGVHGAVRDLRNDRAHRVRTTAILLGADVVDGAVVTTPALLVYAGLLQLALIGLLISALAAGSFPVAAMVGSVALLAVATGFGIAAYRRRHDLRRAMVMGTWHLVLAAASPLALYTSAMPWWATLVGGVAFVTPPLLYGRALRGLDFDLPSTVAAGPAVVEEAPPGRVRTLLAMTRPGTWAAGAGLALIGGSLGGVRWPDAAVVAVAVALIVAAGNVYNDRCDTAADRVNRPWRPLPSGGVAGVTADRFVLTTVVAAVGAASLLGPAAALVTGLGCVLALAYSLLLRRWVVTGATTVALLFASPLPFGAAFSSDGVTGTAWFAAVLVFLFVLSREFLMGVPDVEGDRRSGYRTIASEFGEPAACAAFQIGVVVFLIVLGLPLVAGEAGVSYALAVVAFAGLPVVVALRRLGREPTAESVSAALRTTGLVFATGMVPLLFLMRG